MDTCRVCGREILVTIRRGTGLCSGLCEDRAFGDAPSASEVPLEVVE